MSSEPFTEPVCARHPGRVTYVLCHRCGAGICPECMVPAPVGFQCPDCVARGRVRVKGPFEPRVTQAIVGLCVLLQVLGMLGIGTSTGFLAEFSLYPYAVAAGDTYRLLSAVFIHSGWLHLGMNMIMLYAMGRSLEPVYGHLRFLTLFLVAGLGGAVASFWLNDPQSIGVGASGAIFGCFAAMFVLGREYRVNTQEIVGVIGLNLLIGFIIPNVDWHAHVGGLVVGAVAGWVLMPHRPRILQVVGPTAIVAFLWLASTVRVHELLSTLG